MKTEKIVLTILLSLMGIEHCVSQGFVNLKFETTAITYVSYASQNVATLPGWGWSPSVNPVDGSTNTVPFNIFALDANLVSLQGTNSPYNLYSAIQGNYSILLQGGSSADPDHNGASIWQTATVPVSSLSIYYWGGPLQASFNGHALEFSAVGITPDYTIWGANISPYAGQTGELRFNAPWQSVALLDNIQFSISPVPEPSTLALLGLGAAAFGCRRWKK